MSLPDMRRQDLMACSILNVPLKCAALLAWWEVWTGKTNTIKMKAHPWKGVVIAKLPFTSEEKDTGRELTVDESQPNRGQNHTTGPRHVGTHGTILCHHFPLLFEIKWECYSPFSSTAITEETNACGTWLNKQKWLPPSAISTFEL